MQIGKEIASIFLLGILAAIAFSSKNKTSEVITALGGAASAATKAIEGN